MKILQIKTTKALDEEGRSTLDRIIGQRKAKAVVSVEHRWQGDSLQLRMTKPPVSGEFAFLDREVTVHLDCPQWVLPLITGELQKQAIGVLSSIMLEAGLIESVKDIAAVKG